MGKLVQKHKKVIVIVLIICIYFALLSLVSFVRASKENAVVREHLVRNENFIVEAGDGRAWVDTDGLHFNDLESTEKKFSAPISLKEFQQIQVEFFVDCPQAFTRSAVLHVDLCTDGYDSDEQEFIVELKKGQNKITKVIDKGSSAPEEAQFRIFCLDAVQCDISNLNVQAIEEIAYTGEITCAVAVVVLLLLLLLTVGIITKDSSKKGIFALRQEDSKATTVLHNIEKSKTCTNCHNKSTPPKDYILFALTITLLVLTIVNIFTVWNLSFHSDIAAYNMLAREQLQTGQLFPDTWRYTTSLVIFSLNNLIAPLSLCIKDQTMLRDIASVVFLAVFVLSVYYFSKKIVKSNFYLVGLILVFSGTSAMVIDSAFVQTVYLSTLIEYFVLLSLFLLSVTEDWEIKNAGCFAVLLVYLAYIGLYGPINFAHCLLPFLGGIILRFFFQYVKSPWEIVNKKLIKIFKIMLPMVTVAAISLVGYRELCHRIDFSSGVDAVYPDCSNIVNAFTSTVLGAIGYRSGVNLWSLQGLTNVLVIFGFLGTVICCVQLFRKYREQPFAIKLLMDMSLVAWAIILYFDATIYFISPGVDRYFFRPWMLMIFLAAYYIYTYIFSQEVLAKAAVVIFLAAFSLPNMLLSIPQVVQYPQSRTAQLGLVNFLKANDLKHGYATYWNAGNNMVLSDFAVEIGGVFLLDSIVPYLWASSITTYDPDAYRGESFLLLTESENAYYSDSDGLRRLGEAKEVLMFEGYIIYVYPYNIAENGFMGRECHNIE